MKEIVTARPDGMTFDEYKLMRKLQNKAIRKMHRNKPSVEISKLMPIRYGYNYHG